MRRSSDKAPRVAPLAIACLKGIVITANERGDVIRGGLVVVDGKAGTIVAVEKEGRPSEHGCEYVEGDDRAVIMPGLVNAHAHVPMAVLEGLARGLTGFEWLRTIWIYESLLRPSDIYLSSLLSIARMLENGITTFSDQYFYEEEVARAVEELGARAALSKGVVEFSEWAPKHTLKDSVDFARKYMGGAGGRITTMIGVHALYSCSYETLREAAEISRETGIRIHMHFSESLDELELVRKRYGATPAELAERLGILEARPLLAHATYLSDDDLKILGRHRPGVAYSPFTIMSWGQGVARVRELIDLGVPVGLATDGPVTGGDLCLLKEAKLALAAQSSRYLRPHALSPREVLEMLTRRAAEALGLGHVVGSVEPGKRADVLLLRLRASRAVGLLDDPVHTVIYNASCDDVRSVYVDGRKVVSAGRVVGLGYEALLERIRGIRDRLLTAAREILKSQG
ncbi:MAG: amidohydrolase family protein [Desulfurococcaceae archaeon]